MKTICPSGPSLNGCHKRNHVHWHQVKGGAAACGKYCGSEASLRFAADYDKMAKHFTEFTNINRILDHLAIIGG